MDATLIPWSAQRIGRVTASDVPGLHDERHCGTASGWAGGPLRIQDCPPNGSDVKLQAASTRGRTSCAPLATMHMVLTFSVCKRRDAVRLALNEPARPAGAAFAGLSASAAS